MVGDVGVGGSNPIRVQSMTTTDTLDTVGTVAQTLRLVEAGCEIVRITAPTVEDARNLGSIRRELRARGLRVPLVADIHFSPAAALEAAEHVEKVRINPGNFADSKRFAVREYSDTEYDAELTRIEERFAPLVEKCKTRGIAMRIGTNHGSLSDRIMNRFGDTPLGMVESALEFARICEKHGYRDLIFSMKASNPKVMIQAYRLLAARMRENGMDYPFHLGVTEAGNGEDGRIKSAIGIGALLEDGIGDTIRVSLTEDPEFEVPVAFSLAAPYQPRGFGGGAPAGHHEVGQESLGGVGVVQGGRRVPQPVVNPYAFARREASIVPIGEIAVGSGQPVRVIHPLPGSLSKIRDLPERASRLASADGLIEARPDALSLFVGNDADLTALEQLRERLGDSEDRLPLIVCVPADFPGLERVARAADMISLSAGSPPLPLQHAFEIVARLRRPLMLEADRSVDPGLDAFDQARTAGIRDIALSVSARDVGVALRAYRLLVARLAERGDRPPIHLVAWPELDVQLRASVLLGSLLCDGIGDSIQVMGASKQLDDQQRARLALNILQGAGVRLSKTEFVACPSCGRTLFNLQETTERIQRQTGHLKGVKIAIMGCIVNGPGEMADADFGYVGGAPGKVNLYVGKECVEKGVPAAIADEKLIELIRKHGKWVSPPVATRLPEPAILA
jgi:(E)-4-hydroxy-3-methylbut-2-enyl-diphosphate synthase